MIKNIMENKTKVNEDLLKERRNCSFNVKELTTLIDEGEENTSLRKSIEEKIANCKELRDPIPVDYMSHKEKYENELRKSCILFNLLKSSDFGSGNYVSSITYKLTDEVIKGVTPVALHVGMFLPTIIGQASDEQKSKWLPKAISMEIIGTYAQTELGHGTFLRGLETTATYDPASEEFVLNSPTLTSYKWWPGGLGQTANHCIVVAQLYIKEKCYGVHPFLIQIRDADSHIPLPGIKVGDIGPKFGFHTANNGFLGFDNCRIPRDAMLMKNAQVLKDGTYVRSKNDKHTYGTMVFVRVFLVGAMGYKVSIAATIAVRYSAVRHQSKPVADEPEPQILDYVTQQHKLFISIATAHAFRAVSSWLFSTYHKVTAELSDGNMAQLPELHALSCGLKAVSTNDASNLVDQCRRACGGHGYMMSSNLPVLYTGVTAANTYEGENTVLHLQTARFLVKAWEQAKKSKKVTPTVSYFLSTEQDSKLKWDNSPECIIRGFQQVAAGRIRLCVETITRHIESGMSYEDAWNAASVQLVGASEAHSRAVLCEVFWKESEQWAACVSTRLAHVLRNLAQLYLIYWALEKTGDLLLYSNISKSDIIALQERYERLLALIRPDAVGLVDAFDHHDIILQSTLGAYDGRVYERLMEEALKSPLNAEPVNQSFHKYLKPFMQGKL